VVHVPCKHHGFACAQQSHDLSCTGRASNHFCAEPAALSPGQVAQACIRHARVQTGQQASESSIECSQPRLRRSENP
jgi:hypothetical protein